MLQSVMEVGSEADSPHRALRSTLAREVLEATKGTHEKDSPKPRELPKVSSPVHVPLRQGLRNRRAVSPAASASEARWPRVLKGGVKAALYIQVPGEPSVECLSRSSDLKPNQAESEWSFQKSGALRKTQTVGLLFKGHPQKGPLIYRNSQKGSLPYARET